jgi:hypothetical protein
VIGGQVRMKFLPDLEFREDQGPARAERVEELLREIHGGAREGRSPEAEEGPSGVASDPPTRREEDRGQGG